jgi:hypothetical protein
MFCENIHCLVKKKYFTGDKLTEVKKREKEKENG